MNNNRPRNPPTFRERINPLETMSDSEIIKRYRLNLECINRLTDIVAAETRRPTNRSHAMAVGTGGGAGGGNCPPPPIFCQPKNSRL